MVKMKREFKTQSGHEGMTIDCVNYTVEIFKSIDNSLNCIKYIEKETNNTSTTTHSFLIDWDNELDGGRISLYYKDKWGSEMIFIHYLPSDLKGMFDFIGKGYNVFKFFKQKIS